MGVVKVGISQRARIEEPPFRLLRMPENELRLSRGDSQSRRQAIQYNLLRQVKAYCAGVDRQMIVPCISPVCSGEMMKVVAPVAVAGRE